jgi:hypothetical protein
MIVSMSIISIVILVITGFIQDSSTSFRQSEVLDTRMEEVEAVCSEKCGRMNALEDREALEKAVSYCGERLSVGDLRGKTVGSGYNTYCSQGARCFNVHSCEFRGRNLNSENCRQIMCKFFEDASDTNETVKKYYEPGKIEGDFGAGKCELSNITDSAGYEVPNWWTENFKGDDVCE